MVEAIQEQKEKEVHFGMWCDGRQTKNKIHHAWLQ